jgi:hypothetical protein
MRMLRHYLYAAGQKSPNHVISLRQMANRVQPNPTAAVPLTNLQQSQSDALARESL